MSQEPQHTEDLRRLIAEGDLDAARRLLVQATRRQDGDDVALCIEALRHAELETDTATLRLMLRALHAVEQLDTYEAILFELEPDLPELGATHLARFPVARYEPWSIRAWALPENLGGYAFLEIHDARFGDIILRPQDRLEITFGDLSAAVGVVPLQLLLHRGKRTLKLYQDLIDDIDGEYVPEAYRDELQALIDAARQHATS